MRTGTDGIPVVDTTWTQAVPGPATPGIDRDSEESTASARIVGKNSANLLNRQALTLLPTEAMTLAAIFDHANRFGGTALCK